MGIKLKVRKPKPNVMPKTGLLKRKKNPATKTMKYQKTYISKIYKA